MKISSKQILKTANFRVEKLLGKNENVKTLGDFDFYFSHFKQALNERGIKVKYGLNERSVEIYFITKDYLEDSFVKTLLNKALVGSFEITVRKEIISYIENSNISLVYRF